MRMKMSSFIVAMMAVMLVAGVLLYLGVSGW